MLEWVVEVDGFEIPLDLDIRYYSDVPATAECPAEPDRIEVESISLFGFNVPQDHAIAKLVDADYDKIFDKWKELTKDWLPW